MPLLDHGVVVADRFANSLVPLADLQAAPASAAGVIVGPTTRPEELAPFLPHLALIAIEFPKFRDGRGFSLARALREQHGFDGEIRAIGHLLPDQHAFLLRCGFSSVMLPDDADLAVWRAALGRYHHAYQRAIAEAAA